MKTSSIRNILVPIDFSEMSMQAVETASRLARRFNAVVHLAHVRQLDYTAAFAASAAPVVPFSVMTYDEDAEKRIAQDLNALAGECAVPSPMCHVLGGAPAYDEVSRLARQVPADLIVMPTHGRTGLKHVFLGSTAERVVQHSPCPVFVVRAGKPLTRNGSSLGINTILVPVDFSDASREALQYAIGFANKFGTKVILLHATYLGYIYSAEGTAIYDIAGLQKAARKNAERKMHELERSVNFARVKFRTVLTEGSPVLDICDFAKDHGVDLIITSTHGLTGLKHVLIGSVAEHVVRRAPCSVLVVPSHPQVRVAHLEKSVGARANKRSSRPELRKSGKDRALTKRDRKLAAHAFPERRNTNKFRESHFTR